MEPSRLLTPRRRGSALLSGIALAGAVLGLASGPASAASAASDTASMCPAGGSLVTYSYGGVLGKTLVVQQDGRAWLCWNQTSGDVGRKGFMLSQAQMNALRGDLGRVGVRHLAPTPRLGEQVATLSYRGATLPSSGRQTTRAAAAALVRAERMLDLAGERQIARG
jgi:hypothetical protein